MKVRIPADDAEASQVAEVATLSGWALAGYIASQVELVGSGRPAKNGKLTVFLTAEQFADKKLPNLPHSAKTIRLYVQRWRDAGLPPPTPGDTVNVPDLPWEPTAEVTTARHVDDDRREAIKAQAQEDGTGASKALDIASNPRAMAAAIKADPRTAEAAAAALTEARKEDPYFGYDDDDRELGQRMERTRVEREAREKEAPQHALFVVNVLQGAINTLKRDFDKVRGHEYTWDDDSRAMLAEAATEAHAMVDLVASLPDRGTLTSETIYAELGL